MNILDIFSEFSDMILLTLAILLVLSWMVFLISFLRINKKFKGYKELITYSGGQNIEEIMVEYGRKIHVLDKGVEHMEKVLGAMNEDLKNHPQHFGMIRFNAFSNTGSDLSFAIALLDDNYNGFVMSSIYGREESRIYAKPLEHGKSTYQLTKEEEQAIEVAKEKKALSHN